MRVVIFLAFFSLVASANNLQSIIQNLIDNPKESYKLKIDYNPFKSGAEIVSKVFKETSSQKSLHVISIINNRAYISSAWRSVGEEFLGYKVLQVNDDSVLVKKEDKIMKLSLKKSSQLLKIRNVTK